jgi:hypothetical protein
VAALKYFRRHRRRMRYASFARRKLPIGSGLVEAACKTLVTSASSAPECDGASRAAASIGPSASSQVPTSTAIRLPDNNHRPRLTPGAQLRV